MKKILKNIEIEWNHEKNHVFCIASCYLTRDKRIFWIDENICC
jgi:hypothetical protein